jgi:hypothetical protein
MSFEISGLNGDLPVRPDFIGYQCVSHPAQSDPGDLGQGHASRRPNDSHVGGSPKPSDMKIISAVPPVRSFGQFSFLLRVSTLEEGGPRLAPSPGPRE